MDPSTLREIGVRVSQYFRDFLETDFKRQQAPRRRIILQSETGFRAGMRIRPYPTLEQELWKLINQPSGESPQLKLTPRRFTRPLSPNLKKVFEEQIDAIPESSFESVRNGVIGDVAQSYSTSINNPEEWIDERRTFLAERVSADLVRPLIARLDGPLQTQAYSLIDSLFAAEGELVSAIACDVDALLPDALAKYLANTGSPAVTDVLSSCLTSDLVRTSLKGFFSSFVTSDAFLEFRDLETYASITEGLQLYLYIGSIKFRDVTYPLFFVPIDVTKLQDGAGYTVEIVNQLFANRRAIDFVLQEMAQARQREWVSPIQERIHYLNPQQSIYESTRGLFRLVANAVDLPGRIELGSTAADVANADVTLSAALTICAFEKGEESLVNDYEELIVMARNGGSAIVDLFEGMVGRMLGGNPVSIGSQVEAQWEGLPLVERLVFDCPIPLNEEQRKVLLAVGNPEGRIIVVEGPPGTGKSHTITAIAADCAFNQRSCLVLSDKAEALEVVQRQLSDVMSQVRHDREFPNPLLRIGRQDANFRRLVSNQTINQVSAYARAMRANQPALIAEKDGTARELKNSIDRTVASLGQISLATVQAVYRHERALRDANPQVLAALVEECCGEHKDLVDAIGAHLEPLREYVDSIFTDAGSTGESIREIVCRDVVVRRFAQGKDLSGWARFQRLDHQQLRALSELLVAYRQLRMPVFGYLFRGGSVRALETKLNALPTMRPLLLRVDGDSLDGIVVAVNELRVLLERERLRGALANAYAVVATGSVAGEGAEQAGRALKAFEKMPSALKLLLVPGGRGASIWVKSIEFLRAFLTVQNGFDDAPVFDYVGAKTKLERLNTSVMNSHVDSRLVNYMEHHRSDAKTLASLIAQRQKFPEDKFEDVRKSFPIIIASIREFGEYMPLVPELFDVVVIDEASQVSVAQALPAILRAKKVVVLGDSKQFSNVKSSHASIAVNDKYRADLIQFFKRDVRSDAQALQRLAMFDVKRSVLEFCGMAASYTIMLRKHFRSYPELIGYSSRTFYDHQLQAIKVRGVPIEEVIRFDLVDATGANATRATNSAEAQFVLDQLIEMLGEDAPPTVGVITPFREQHTLLSKLLFGHPMAQEFESRLRLKVMTFDSCQGEERQIIFYSMVATPGNDALNYVFPVSIGNAADSVEEKLKIQRLNVGFSRAQEMIWIVHSMPLELFRGSIAGALNHYRAVLAKPQATADQTDQASPMEAKVLQWLYTTEFYQSESEDLEVLPQFPIGEYLRQLDPTYQHPSWRVDFLLTYRGADRPIYIVIEYDGFEHHFDGGSQVHVGNHERYLRDSDVERQLTLESYGYRFIRINRFNLGKDPIATLNGRLEQVVATATGTLKSGVAERIRNHAEGLVNGEFKSCPKCGAVKPLQQFFRAELKEGAGGHGRNCNACATSSEASKVKPAVKRQGSRFGRRRRWR